VSVEPQLRERGFAIVRGFVDPARCAELAAMYDDDERFRSTVVMERHAYGRGEYRYFRNPLPAPVAELRAGLYDELAPIANAWAAELGERTRYPATLTEMLERCAAHGQLRPTPLLLRYGAGDYNALHQDLYGEIAFPLQGTVLLTDAAAFSGGEFVLVEGRARRQSVAHVIALGRGDLIVFPNRYKPNPRGGRSTFRHGVAELRSGARITLGLILHDAK
jgi:hypothetical protein